MADAEAEALYDAEFAALDDDIAGKKNEFARTQDTLERKKAEYIDWFLDDCEGNNGYTTGVGLAQKCRLCGDGKEPNDTKSSCVESTASKEDKMDKDRDNCESKNAFWQITDEDNFKGRCVVCSGAYEPGYAMNADGTMGDAMSCQKTQETAAVMAASYQTMYETARDYLNQKMGIISALPTSVSIAGIRRRKGAKISGSIRLGPGTYGYEISGAGGGGGRGGSFKVDDCATNNNIADGGDGGDGELKIGTFTIDNVTDIKFSVGGNISGAGTCGDDSEKGAVGENSTLTYDGTTIIAAGGGGGEFHTSHRKATPSGNGALGGFGGGKVSSPKKSNRSPQNGAAGWFLLTSYTP
jgi:hypothetical protein